MRELDATEGYIHATYITSFTVKTYILPLKLWNQVILDVSNRQTLDQKSFFLFLSSFQHWTDNIKTSFRFILSKSCTQVFSMKAKNKTFTFLHTWTDTSKLKVSNFILAFLCFLETTRFAPFGFFVNLHPVLFDTLFPNLKNPEILRKHNLPCPAEL